MPRRPRHPLRWSALLLGAIFLLAACGEEDRSDPTPAETPVETEIDASVAPSEPAPPADEDDPVLEPSEDGTSATISEADQVSDAGDPGSDTATDTGATAEPADGAEPAASTPSPTDPPRTDPPLSDPPPTTEPPAPTTTEPAPAPLPDPPAQSGSGISAEEIARIEAQLDEIDRLLADLEASLAAD